MRVDRWLKLHSTCLQQAGIESARLDCLILLEDATGHDRAWLLAHPEFELPDTKISRLNTQISKREQHLPLAYIRGHAAFYGREFTVNEHVLVPRPESEMMIELFKTWPKDAAAGAANKKTGMAGTAETAEVTIADLGTGSGALAITAKLEAPEATVIGSDIDPDCLAVARHNARALQADCLFLQADLLGPEVVAAVGSAANRWAILANLPYVPDSYPINRAASHEPKLALFAGVDGLDAYRRLWRQIHGLPAGRRPQLVITEALETQHHALATLARHYGYLQHAKEGLAQAFTPL